MTNKNMPFSVGSPSASYVEGYVVGGYVVATAFSVQGGQPSQTDIDSCTALSVHSTPFR
jgi:hypothetical protein